MGDEAIKARIAALEAKLAKRRAQAGFEQNVIAIEAEIARLQGELNGPA